MTIIVILIGLFISHFFTAVGSWRRYDWLLWPMREARHRFGQFAWMPLAMVIAVSLVIGVGLAGIVTRVAGTPGWLVLALLTVVYTFGPRDLDRDVDQVLDDPGHADGREAAEALGLGPRSGSVAAAAAVFDSARERWFGILFWFVLLGIPGALLYRLTQQTLTLSGLTPDEADWLARLRWILEWPVLALMLLAAGLSADFDRVHQAWKGYHRERPVWLLSPAVFREVAARLVEDSSAIPVGLRLARRLVWRMLVLWLVIMSLMLLAGWLA